MRTKLHREEAHELLLPYYPQLIDVFYYADQRTKAFKQTDLANGDSEHHASVVSMTMWHYAMNRTIQNFRDNPDFVPNVFNQQFGLLFMDVLFIKFKKLDENYKTSNYPTKQALAISSQERIAGFPDKPCFLNAGYKLNGTETEIESINLTCTTKKEGLLWRINLSDFQESAMPEIPFNPIDEPVSPSIEKLLQIKADRRKKRSGTID